MMNNYPPPFNNPVAMLAMAMRKGQNPMQVIQSLAMRDPQAAQFMRMVQGKTPAQLKQMADNVAANNGTTVDEVARRLGLMWTTFSVTAA